MTDPLLLDATTQLQLLATGRLAAIELLEASVMRAQAQKTRINAVAGMDLEAARARARTLDDRRTLLARSGEPLDSLGLLAGLPMTVADVLDVDGLPATAGLESLAARAAADADAVGRIKAAGAVVWGKTNVPPMADDWQARNALYGQTNNPWDPARTCGGASGGAAAALAVGISALEIGSDIDGGLRAPASFCGVFSHKPTFGLVSQRGHVPPKPGSAREGDLNVIGPMARSARDLRLLLSILSPAAIPARSQPVQLIGLKVGLWLDEPAFVLDPEVGDVVERFANRLADAGALVEAVTAPVKPGRLLETYTTLLMAVRAASLPDKLWRKAARRRPIARLSRLLGAGPSSPAARTLALTASHRDWMAADEARARLALVAARFFETHHVLIAPAAPVAAFRHLRGARAERSLRLSRGRAPYGVLAQWPAFASALGLPATTVPVGLTAHGLPVGVQIIGPSGADSRTLAVAQAIDDALGGFVPPPAP